MKQRIEGSNLVGLGLETVDDLLEVLGEDVALGDSRGGVEDLVLVGELDVDSLVVREVVLELADDAGEDCLWGHRAVDKDSTNRVGGSRA